MVREPDGVEGLVTPLIVTRTESPAGIDLPESRKQVIASPDGGRQAPMPLAPVVVSSTEEADTDPMPVPEGNTKVTRLPAPFESPPPFEVVNLTTYTVRAPAAADGAELSTVTLLTNDEEAERADPASATSSTARTDTAAIRRQRLALPCRRRVWVPLTSPALRPSGSQHSPNSRRHLKRELRRRSCGCPIIRVSPAGWAGHAAAIWLWFES